MDILKDLQNLSDKEYAIFQAKLTPNISKDNFIGVRVPVLRKYAKEIAGLNETKEFMEQLPHKYYDENMLHSLLLSLEKNYQRALELTDKFLPFVDNWAVCDILSPKCFKKNKLEFLQSIKKWVDSDKAYTIRFSVEMLMSFYLDDDFKKEYLQIPLKVKSNEYYVNMMLAWFYATALSKQWDSTISILENKLLSTWVHNKTIQKAIESYRITENQKEYLRTLKIK